MSTSVQAQQACLPVAKADSIVPMEVRLNCSGGLVMQCEKTFHCLNPEMLTDPARNDATNRSESPPEENERRRRVPRPDS